MKVPKWLKKPNTTMGLRRSALHLIRAASDGRITRAEARALLQHLAGEVFDHVAPPAPAPAPAPAAPSSDADEV